MTSTVSTSAVPPPPCDGLDQQVIGGTRRAGYGAGATRVTDPYSGQVLNKIRNASVADVDAAFKATHVAHAAWAQRAALLRFRCIDCSLA